MTTFYQEQAFKDGKKFLNPEKLKANLLRASIFLASYELLRSSVVDHIRGFFIEGFHGDKDIINPRYKVEVVDLHPKDLFHASCLWFKSQGAISDSDISLIKNIRHHRNDIAHELPKYISEAKYQVNMQFFASIYSLLSKIDRWWIRQIEIPINSDFDGQDPEEIPDDQIISGKMITMNIILKVIHGQEDELEELYRYFVQEWKKRADSNN
jgi:hypothetical protein